LFAQQAAEKALKALYIEQQGALAPRTHDLLQLGTSVGTPQNVQADLATLNPAFDMVRYPSPRSTQAPVNVVDATIAKEHLEAAERVLQWVQAQLP
jgi:HEPN domain-containing protein